MLDKILVRKMTLNHGRALNQAVLFLASGSRLKFQRVLKLKSRF